MKKKIGKYVSSTKGGNVTHYCNGTYKIWLRNYSGFHWTGNVDFSWKQRYHIGSIRFTFQHIIDTVWINNISRIHNMEKTKQNHLLLGNNDCDFVYIIII